jgi:hypothetical protein
MLVSAFEIRRHDHERQHYRLSVTNLEDRDFEYSVEFHGEQSSGSASSFSGTTTLAFTLDGGAAEDAVVFLRQPHVYGPAQKLRRFIIPPRRTALLELYAPGPNRLDARGFVVLRLPTKPMVSGGLRSVPQSDHPVQVMLDAASHITRVPEDFIAGSTGVVLAHSDGLTHPYAVSIALASGKAENLLDPEGEWRIKDIERASLQHIKDLITGHDYRGAQMIPEENRLAALLELLSQIDTDERTFEQLNRLLAEAGISIRFC